MSGVWGTTLRFAKTERGEAELERPAIDLPHRLRSLLDMIDVRHSVAHCLAAIAGTHVADFLALFREGLIQPVPETDDEQHALAIRIAHDIVGCDSGAIYDLVTSQARRCLGLLDAFQIILALERCTDLHGHRMVAFELILEVARSRQAAGLRRLEQAARAARAPH